MTLTARRKLQSSHNKQSHLLSPASLPPTRIIRTGSRIAKPVRELEEVRLEHWNKVIETNLTGLSGTLDFGKRVPTAPIHF
jgi:hypothetical protein